MLSDAGVRIGAVIEQNLDQIGFPLLRSEDDAFRSPPRIRTRFQDHESRPGVGCFLDE